MILVVVVTSLPRLRARRARADPVAEARRFVLAARALGAPAPRILPVHVLPNLIGPLLILACMDIPVVITIEAGLSFLGLGVRPPTPSWGTILNDGFAFIRESPGWRSPAACRSSSPRSASPSWARRCATCSTRGCGRRLSAAWTPLLDVRDLSVDFRTPRGPPARAARRRPRRAARRDRRHRRRNRLRQVHADQRRDRAARRQCRDRGRRDPLQGRDLLRMPRGRAAAAARRPHHHGLPGPDDGAQSGAVDRHPDDRHPVPRPGAARAPSAGAPSRCWSKVGIPDPEQRLAAIRTSSPAACASASASPWRCSPSPTC